MLGIKCIGSALFGGVIGFVVFIVGWIALKVLVGLVFWNAQLGTDVAAFAILAIPAGIVIGFMQPINADAKVRAQEAADLLVAQNAVEEAEQRRIASEAKQRKLAEEALNQKRAREAAKLDNECRSLAVIRNESGSAPSRLSGFIRSAEDCLNRAQDEFQERAFAPFWDAIEQATNFLSAYHECIETMKNTVTEYKFRRLRLSASIPDLVFPSASIPDARPLANRLNDLCRAGQRDFQFATIYEQRKTNHLLYSGFGTLASGLGRMQTALTDILQELSSSLGTKLDELIAVSEAQVDAFSDFSDASREHFSNVDEHNATVAEHSKAMEILQKEANAERDKQSEMLDNIQRGKKPPEGVLERVFSYRMEGDTTKPHDVSADD